MQSQIAFVSRQEAFCENHRSCVTLYRVFKQASGITPAGAGPTRMLKNEISARSLAVQGSVRGEAPLLHLGAAFVAAFVVLNSCFEACLWHLILIDYAIHHLH